MNDPDYEWGVDLTADLQRDRARMDAQRMTQQLSYHDDYTRDGVERYW